MDTLLQDLRYSARRLARTPGFTIVAVVTLALGIGANSAIFSVVNAVLFRPLPYPEADRLVTVNHLTDDGSFAVMSPPNFRDVRAQNTVLEEMSPFTPAGFTLTGRGEPVRLDGAKVGEGYFDVLRVEPVLGRTFRPGENEPGTRVAILAHGTWANRFGSDPSIIGTTMTLNGDPYEVVGVMPEGFSFPGGRDVYVPMEHDETFMAEDNRGAWYLTVIGRLKPGATVEQAASQIGQIADRLEQAYPESNTGLAMSARSLHEATVGNLRTPLLVLLGAVGLVLLIACANVANLLLARAAGRETELAVRTALGAARGRLVRQLLTESVLLGALGGAAGLIVAIWGSALLVSMQPEGVPRLDTVGVDSTVVAFTLLIAVLTGLIFGLVPAARVGRRNLAASIRDGGRGPLSGRGSKRARSGLVVAEVALAMVLLTGAGLLMQSFINLQRVDPGFQPHGALTFRLALPQAEYETDEERAAFYQQLTERLERLPGAQSAAAVMALPLTSFGFAFSFEVDGWEPALPGEEPSINTRIATTDYFRTMGIPVVRGRAFTRDDRAGAPQVVVINEAAVRRYFPDEDPIGKNIRLGWGRDEVDVGGQVVGVVGDIRESELGEEAAPTLWAPHAQVAMGGMAVVVRTAVPPLSLAGAVRQEIAAMDPDIPLSQLRPLEVIVSESVSRPRFYMSLLAIFAGVALALAAIGIFGVISYTVAQRTREIGIRVALGADTRHVLRMIVGGAVGLAAAGIILGVLGSIASMRLISGLLYEVGTTDPLTFGAVSLMLLSVAALASFLPARAATRVDPNVSLRAE